MNELFLLEVPVVERLIFMSVILLYISPSLTSVSPS